ncbi:G protein-coupled glucose receptor regulating Gpa2-domain-containing protein [Hyaloscypha finlandica]|nr:G protein-coupled glucose receptor regulating Gpa2-domain-containing protein [Hyaloscypha finlandica]
MTLDLASQTLSPLPEVLSHGLVAVSTFGLLSFFCSASLFFFLTWRLITWRLKSGPNNPPNQFLLLIYNLLLADIQQALAFLLNLSALRNNGIFVGTPTCFAQGWFVSTGDLASGVFICAIACHTWMGVVKEYRLPTPAFYCCIGTLWFFVYIMAAVGPIIHGRDFYVRASAWCWINDAFQIERLWLHYFWIFCSMFSTILIYLYIFAFLRKKAVSSNDRSSPHHYGATPLMVLYPLIYTVCTAPLAAGRIYALAGHDVSLGYFCAAGTMIACNGWLDVILYASTRADIVFSEHPPGDDTGLETFAFMGKGHRLGTTTTIVAAGSSSRNHSVSRAASRSASRAAPRGASRLGRRSGRGSNNGESAENLYGLGEIAIKNKVTVSVDAQEHNLVRHDRISMDESANRSRTFDERSHKSRGSRSSRSGKSFDDTEIP